MDRPFDVLPCGYVAFTDDGAIRETNHVLLSWLGYQKDELQGQSIERIFTLASRIFYNTHFFPLIKLQSQASEIFLSLRDKEGGDVPVLSNAMRSLGESGETIHCVFIRVDERKKFEQQLLEEKRRAEEALRENQHLAELTKSLESHALELEKHYQHQTITNEDLVQFSKIISHDLQEPIHKIQVFMDQINQDPDSVLSAKSRILTDKIISAAKRLRSLTKSLDEYLAVDDEKSFGSVDLNAIIRTALTRASNYRGFSDFDIAIKPMPVIDGYEKQLEIMFFHLIDNAIQFREPTRRLAIGIDQTILRENLFRFSKNQYRYADYVRIQLEDNAIGFAEEYNSYVFKLLNKVHSSTGAGIGLPLVKKIVQNHSGIVRVKSFPGKGTQFEIELPLKLGG